MHAPELPAGLGLGLGLSLKLSHCHLGPQEHSFRISLTRILILDEPNL